jgi:hypothetical protein
MYLDADALPDTPDNRVLMAKKMRGIVRQAPMAPKRAASPRTGDETDAQLHRLYHTLLVQTANELVRKRMGQPVATDEEVEVVITPTIDRLEFIFLLPRFLILEVLFVILALPFLREVKFRHDLIKPYLATRLLPPSSSSSIEGHKKDVNEGKGKISSQSPFLTDVLDCAGPGLDTKEYR